MQLIVKVLLLLLIPVALPSLYCQQPNARDGGYFSALNLILKEKILKELTGTTKPKWTVSVIGSPPFGKDEILFGLAKYQNDEVKLIKVSPQSSSVYRQRERLLKKQVKNPASRILVSSSVVTSTKCLELSRIAERWETLTLRLIPENSLLLDSTNYTVKVESLFGDMRVITFAGGNLEADRSSSLVILIGDTLSKCAVS